jgi:hypothetical protein
MPKPTGCRKIKLSDCKATRIGEKQGQVVKWLSGDALTKCGREFLRKLSEAAPFTFNAVHSPQNYSGQIGLLKISLSKPIVSAGQIGNALTDSRQIFTSESIIPRLLLPNYLVFGSIRTGVPTLNKLN